MSILLIFFIIIFFIIEVVAFAIAADNSYVSEIELCCKYECSPEYTKFGNLFFKIINFPLYYSILMWFYLFEGIKYIFSLIFINKNKDIEC
jgi:hypothetical protein